MIQRRRAEDPLYYQDYLQIKPVRTKKKWKNFRKNKKCQSIIYIKINALR